MAHHGQLMPAIVDRGSLISAESVCMDGVPIICAHGKLKNLALPDPYTYLHCIYMSVEAKHFNPLRNTLNPAGC